MAARDQRIHDFERFDEPPVEILADGDGHVWVGTDRALFEIDGANAASKAAQTPPSTSPDPACAVQAGPGTATSTGPRLGGRKVRLTLRPSM